MIQQFQCWAFIQKRTLYSENICTPVFIAALITLVRTWKQPKRPSIDKRIKKMWYKYTMEYYLATVKNEIMSFSATWMDLKTIILSEVR